MKGIIKDLEHRLADVEQRLSHAEDDNRRLTKLAAGYRVDWINEYRRAEILARHMPDENFNQMESISQAGWDSSSPYRVNGESRQLYRPISS